MVRRGDPATACGQWPERPAATNDTRGLVFSTRGGRGGEAQQKKKKKNQPGRPDRYECSADTVEGDPDTSPHHPLRTQLRDGSRMVMKHSILFPQDKEVGS